LGNYSEVGKIAIRATFVCTLLLLPFVLALALWTESILVYLGQDATASRLAKEWVRIYLCGLPATIIFRVTQRFMGAQHIVWPMVYSAMLSSFVVHPILLHFLVDAFGFSGSALAVAATQNIQSILVLIYLKIKNLHHPATWPGLTRSYISEAIQNKTMLQFIKLGLGGVFSWSEWWFWETMCFTAGKFGVIPLCVHTVAYQLIPICWMVPFGTSIALSIRIGCILPVNASSAQKLASWCMVCSILWASFVAILVYILQPFLVPLLTTDNAVIEVRLLLHDVKANISNLFCDINKV
jgi:MATE family multidrug resistance protein